MTRHATHPPAVPMVVLDVEGDSGSGAANGPLECEGTRVRTRDNDDCRSTAHTTRPSMSLVCIVRKLLTCLPD